MKQISTHALLAEGDYYCYGYIDKMTDISTHALLAEGDFGVGYW